MIEIGQWVKSKHNDLIGRIHSDFDDDYILVDYFGNIENYLTHENISDLEIVSYDDVLVYIMENLFKIKNQIGQ